MLMIASAAVSMLASMVFVLIVFVKVVWVDREYGWSGAAGLTLALLAAVGLLGWGLRVLRADVERGAEVVAE